VGDLLYGLGQAEPQRPETASRLCLHAYKIAIRNWRNL
jgi:23S rRNA-/tRNA-specific pseudouridylate synthase